ncbi:MAG: hypothetical protein ACJ76K_13590, partial [Solirubrobacteraceae bacterium]
MRKITLPLVALVAVALAVSLAGPAFGGTHVTGSASTLKTGKKALRTAKAAKRLATRALADGGAHGAPPQASCHLEYAAGNNPFTRMGEGEPTVFLSGALNDFKQVGVTGYADVDPGSYD